MGYFSIESVAETCRRGIRLIGKEKIAVDIQYFFIHNHFLDKDRNSVQENSIKKISLTQCAWLKSA